MFGPKKVCFYTTFFIFTLKCTRHSWNGIAVPTWAGGQLEWICIDFGKRDFENNAHTESGMQEKKFTIRNGETFKASAKHQQKLKGFHIPSKKK